MNPLSPVPGFLVVAAAAVSLVLLLGAATFLLIVICCRVARWFHHRALVRQALEQLGRSDGAAFLQHHDVQDGLGRLETAINDEEKGGTS